MQPRANVEYEYRGSALGKTEPQSAPPRVKALVCLFPRAVGRVCLFPRASPRCEAVAVDPLQGAIAGARLHQGAVVIALQAKPAGIAAAPVCFRLESLAHMCSS